jgi:hypothetical protein
VLVEAGSTFLGNRAEASGGAVSNDGTLTIANSLLERNWVMSAVGGAIANFGTLTVTNSTLLNNISGNVSRGGAIYNSGIAAVTNSTLTGNRTDAIRSSGSATVTHSTFTGNTGYALAVEGAALTVGNSVIGRGTYSVARFAPMGELVSTGFNLAGDTPCAAQFTMTGDRNNVDARLAPLAFNGGFTRTHLPLPGSPAIDGGGGADIPTTDQRDRPRPYGAAPDIGAVEVQPFPRYLPIVGR